MSFHLRFITSTGEYRTNHFGIVENGSAPHHRVLGCIPAARLDEARKSRSNELLSIMSKELKENSYIVVQTLHNHRAKPYDILPGIVGRIIYEF